AGRRSRVSVGKGRFKSRRRRRRLGARVVAERERAGRSLMDLWISDHLDRREVPLDEFYESRLRLLEKYDAAGFSAYHLAVHHATPLGLAPVPGIFLAAATQRTRRIRLGPCVYCLPLD